MYDIQTSFDVKFTNISRQLNNELKQLSHTEKQINTLNSYIKELNDMPNKRNFYDEYIDALNNLETELREFTDIKDEQEDTIVELYKIYTVYKNNINHLPKRMYKSQYQNDRN